MSFKKITLAVAGCAALMAGQAAYAQPNGTSVPTIFPPPAQAFDEVKQHLGLSDAQLATLRQILEQKDKALQDHWKKVMDKQTELNNLLQANSTDAVRIGQLTIEIHNFRKQQAPDNNALYRQQALAVLTPDQRTKLVPLDQALKLNQPAYQAVSLSLIEPPPPGLPRILPADGSQVPEIVVPAPVPGY